MAGRQKEGTFGQQKWISTMGDSFLQKGANTFPVSLGLFPICGWTEHLTGREPLFPINEALSRSVKVGKSR